MTKFGHTAYRLLASADLWRFLCGFGVGAVGVLGANFAQTAAVFAG